MDRLIDRWIVPIDKTSDKTADCRTVGLSDCRKWISWILSGARDWSRTSTSLRTPDSESGASTNSATRAARRRVRWRRDRVNSEIDGGMFGQAQRARKAAGRAPKGWAAAGSTGSCGEHSWSREGPPIRGVGRDLPRPGWTATRPRGHRSRSGESRLNGPAVGSG
jgi:hypothetical protein